MRRRVLRRILIKTMDNNIIYAANCGEFKQAFEKLTNGGTVIVTDTVVLESIYLAKHSGTVTVTAKEKGKLMFDTSVTLTLGGETLFENITIDVKTSGVIAANFSPLTFGENVNVICDFSEEANGLYLVGGENNVQNEKGSYVSDTSITVCSGKISRLVGFSRGCPNRIHNGHATINVKGDAYVRYLVAGAMGDGAVAKSASVRLSESATIEALHIGGAREENILTGDFDMFVDGGDIYRFDRVGLSAVKGKRSITYNPLTAPNGLAYLARLALIDDLKSTCETDGHIFGKPFKNPFGSDTTAHSCTVCGFTELLGETEFSETENVVFVADGGFGNGSTPNYPLGDYAKAFEKLGKDGGTIVIVGKCTLKANLCDQFEKLSDAYQEPRHSGTVTVTSVYGGKDYRGAASLFFERDIDYRMSGPTTFENLNFAASDNAKRNRIIARYNPLIIEKGCTTPTRDGYKLDIIGGYLQFRYTDFDGAVIENEYENLVGVCRSLPTDHKIDNLVPIERFPNFSLRSEAAAAFNRMFDDMEKEGLKVPTVTDAMRPYARQYALFTGYLGRLRRTFGYSFEQARQVVMRSCAIPGCSEHQFGVAVDMYHLDMVQYGSKKHHYFDITPEWAWVHENGKNYGIVLRYAADKTDITGCIYEAWHFRYVGKTVAKILMAKGISLEEYMGAKLGLLNLDSFVNVKSGAYNSISPFSFETGLLQLTGKHFVSIDNCVSVKEKSTELSEC
ncbi:MAG: D-alanyl-D-alanine carboxypeptidase family protein [Ruminococcaceae bacterium]|nr:D-alanyl-D-alanine carboxypeptidase family protein [Oscillospiraceae bacterium]